RTTGMEEIAYLDSVGISGKRATLAHCVWVDPHEVARLARQGTNVAHCPSSNLKLGSGIAKVPELLEAGCRVALGADGAACNNRLDMFAEMRLAALIQKPRLGADALPAGKVLELATLGGARAPADSGERVLYRDWCSKCHGADGRGVAAATTRLSVPPADLRTCQGSTAETERRWIGIVTRGGAAFGLSLDMPAFGEAATPEQIRAVVRYARSLCGESGWPPGELNFPRAFLVEKAFPENEWVVVEQGRGQKLVYERRLGKRLQLE